MQNTGLRHISGVVARVLASAAIGLGGSFGSIVAARDIADHAPLVTHTIPPGGSLTYESGCTYNVATKGCDPQWTTVVNNSNGTETIQLREAGTGRRLAELGAGAGGILLSMAGAAGAWALTERRREDDVLELDA